MFKKNLSLCLAIFLVCIGKATFAQKESPNNVVSEKHIVEIDFSSWKDESFTVSSDSKRMAYAARVGDKWFVVADGKEEKHYDGIVQGSLIFSPDSKRVMYAARVGDKWFVVADGKEEKHYDGIMKGFFIFSPDSKRMALKRAKSGSWWQMVKRKSTTITSARLSSAPTANGWHMQLEWAKSGSWWQMVMRRSIT